LLHARFLKNKINKGDKKYIKKKQTLVAIGYGHGQQGIAGRHPPNNRWSLGCGLTSSHRSGNRGQPAIATN
jgi:hypothetical protein